MLFDDSPLRSSRLLEAMRAYPAQLVHVFILAQALAWVVVLAIVPASPPYEVVAAVVIGREGLLGTGTHPPLAAWLLGALDALSGGSQRVLIIAGVLVQALALWAAHRLARMIYGEQQGALAVLLLAGVWWVTWTPPVLDPDHLLLAFYPLTALLIWTAAHESRTRTWAAAAAGMALLALSKYVAILLILALYLALAVSARGRAVLRTVEPWGALLMAGALLTPHLTWLLAAEQGEVAYALSNVGVVAPKTGALAWVGVLGLALVGHLGLGLLVALAVMPRAREKETVPTFPRAPLDEMARRFVLVVAIAPLVLLAAAGIALGTPVKTTWLAPLFVFSGLLAVLALGESIALYRQVLVGRVLAAFVVGAPLVYALGAVIDPWRGAAPRDDNWPSVEIARWFTDIYRVRTGKPLAIVAGDTWTAGTLALASRDRPTVFLDGDPKRSPWIGPEAVRTAGALVVWRVAGGDGVPPPHLRARFPGLVVEAPRAFEWAVSGRLAPIRIGWAIVPPRR